VVTCKTKQHSQNIDVNAITAFWIKIKLTKTALRGLTLLLTLAKM